ncbi:3'-5' exonuclease [Gemelliphila palaticanis]|uniref:3'-5' exonuclease n=1 Tax=Gemelliphila palaticanis TaxID=81950 RepID=A0ABX2T1E7_9BACL|nr:3'-5' exonuclease [Gemella palaticanis]MBF0715319.1 3'-5' exonuclease [Gemella palaticanis]NYS47249.1 3'-5' exonuclease [Gemella palaticanis]
MNNNSFSIVDIEVTEEKEIFQIAIINTDSNFNIIGKYNFLIKPTSELSNFLIALTGITNKDLDEKPTFSEVAHNIYEKIKDNILICHGVIQDLNILKDAFSKLNIDYSPQNTLDTVELCKIFFPTFYSYKLIDIADQLNILEEGKYHQADFDTYITYKIIKKIIEKINSFPSTTFEDILTYLKYSTDYSYYFVLDSKLYDIKFNKNYLKYKNIYYNEIFENINNDKEYLAKQIFISSINEQTFNDIHLSSNNTVVLKSVNSYVNIEFISYLKENFNDLNNNTQFYSLLIKLIIWLLETTRGEYSELNLNLVEENLLEELISNFKYKKGYYYNVAYNNAVNSTNIISNYKSLLEIVTDSKLNKSIFVFENKNILGLEIKKHNLEKIYYKDVVTELNIFENKTRNSKISKIKDNISFLVEYLYEMYISESIELYNEAINFIEEDIKSIINSLEKIKSGHYLIKTSQFLNSLLMIIKDNNNGEYKFEIIKNKNTMLLIVRNIKNEKSIINRIQQLNYKYLNSVISNKINNKIKTKNFNANIIYDDTIKNKLLVFNNNKYKELHYYYRDKKINMKYKNFSYDLDFYNLYNDLKKIDNQNYICYSNRDILYYKMYLKHLFEIIIKFENIEK